MIVEKSKNVFTKEENNVVVNEVIDEEGYQILKQDLNKKDDFFTIEDLEYFLKDN